MMNTENLNQTSSEFTCEFCKREFKRERTLLSHSCRQKLRHQESLSPDGKLAFAVYDKFYQQTQRKSKTWEQFAESPYYNGFTKFAKYIRSMDVVNPMLFVDWVIKNNIKLEYWAKDTTYERYLTQLLANESAANGIERTFHHMQEWAEENNLTFEQYLYHASTNKIVHDIISGRISPWLLYGTKTGQEVLAKFNDEQVHLIIRYIDPAVWYDKIKEETDQMEFVRSICGMAGIN